MTRDRTSALLGTHPFAVEVYFGDTRVRAYVEDERGVVAGPGVQALTPATGEHLVTHRVSASDLHAAARHLQTDLPYLLNLAGQSTAATFAVRLEQLATAAGHGTIDPATRRTLDALKQSVDAAQGLGPQAIVRAAMGYLTAATVAGGQPYEMLIGHVNHILTNPGRNPRTATTYPAITGIADIHPDGIQLWWVKEGSATIVFQVRVPLTGGRPPARFVLNVAKDTTSAASELRQTYGDFIEHYRADPASVMEPYGSADVPVNTARGPVSATVLAAEWFDGHELHVYEGSSQLHVWQDQRMSSDHPIPRDVSDRIWEQVIRMRARYTRLTPAGLVPIATHINAGDYIFRKNADDEWDVLLIWTRRPGGELAPGDYLVVAALLGGVSVFGSEQGRTVWWDQPERALAALRAGLTEAGFRAPQIDEVLRHAYAGPFTQYADNPTQLPLPSPITLADHDELHRVFARARGALKADLER